jgi:hypothetical protein
MDERIDTGFEQIDAAAAVRRPELPTAEGAGHAALAAPSGDAVADVVVMGLLC